MKGNGKVTLALVQSDIQYLKSYQEATRSDIKEIKDILLKGSSEIATVKSSVNAIWKTFGILISILSLALAVVALK